MADKGITRGNLIESEKLLERKLNKAVEKAGGWSIKLFTAYVSGLPDRLCLLPGGRLFFAEVKTTKKLPRAVQIVIHKKLRKMGFRVELIDNSEKIKQILSEYERI